ncbi:MAG: helix-turn-helix transcriptional regulator [Patescibacteria group bacterium]
MMKTSKQLERHLKGLANHTRLDILFLVFKDPELNVENITDTLGKNFKTISEHTRRLVQAGLLDKRYKGRSVIHSLSPYGKKFVNFLKNFN